MEPGFSHGKSIKKDLNTRFVWMVCFFDDLILSRKRLAFFILCFILVNSLFIWRIIATPLIGYLWPTR